jgi:hypothetical protein
MKPGIRGGAKVVIVSLPSESLEPSICRASYHCIRIATNNSNPGEGGRRHCQLNRETRENRDPGCDYLSRASFYKFSLLSNTNLCENRNPIVILVYLLLAVAKKIS